MFEVRRPSLKSRLLPTFVVIWWLLGGTASHGWAEEHPPSKALPEKGRTTRVFLLENVPATDVASAVEEFVHSEREVRSGITPPMETIVVPDKVRNLVVVSGPAGKLRVVEDLIAELDKRPRMIRAPCKLIEIGPDGKQSVLSRPVVMTLEGQAAEINVGELVRVVEPGFEASHVHAGCSISLKVHLSEDNTARLEASVCKQEVDKSASGGIRLVKKSVQIIETVRLGSPVKLVVDKADDGSARNWWELVLSEVEPAPAGPEDASPSKTAGREKSQTKEVRHGRVYPSVRR